MEGTLKEVKVLFDGLATTSLGTPAAIKALPVSAPDMARDAPVFALLSVMLFAFNWGARLLVVEPLVGALFRMRPGKVRKCAQSIMEAVFYGCFTAVGLFVVPSQPWVWPSELWFAGYTDGGHEIMRSDLRGYYILYNARYVQMFFSVLLEPKRNDFAEMLIHHAVTVIATTMSFFSGLNRVGVVIMLLMDPADLPLHLAKVCKYVSECTRSRVWQLLADRLFEVFAVAFFVTRLVMYSYVVWSELYEGTRHIPNYGGVAGKICIGASITLLLLQCYWFYLIMKVAVKLMIEGGPVEDVRSEDEDEGSKSSEPPATAQSWLGTFVCLILVVPVVAHFGRQAWNASADSTAVLAELQKLLGGLWTVLRGDAAGTKALSHAPPNIPLDGSVFMVFALVFFVLNWGVRLLLVEPLVRSMLSLGRSQLAKFAQSVMEAVFYGGFTLIGVMVVPSQEWVWPSAKWWMGFASGGHEIMRADLRCYYIMYMARYSQAVLSVLLEPKRKDIVEMIVHHVVTVVVIYISYLYGWNRVGVVVMVLLDPADVPLHLAKLCKYTAEATKYRLWQFVADRLFEVFALVFFVTRLALYGYVCWSAHIEATRYFPKGLPEWTCVALLYTLLLLQMYWFFLIIKVAMKLLQGQSAEDPRSDDEDESEVQAPDGKKRK